MAKKHLSQHSGAYRHPSLLNLKSKQPGALLEEPGKKKRKRKQDKSAIKGRSSPHAIFYLCVRRAPVRSPLRAFRLEARGWTLSARRKSRTRLINCPSRIGLPLSPLSNCCHMFNITPNASQPQIFVLLLGPPFQKCG